MTFRRDWDADGWQMYALQLVQRRHGPQNVQTVPDRVRGDAGIEFFSTDGCLYQCYAPEETADVRKAASAMKRKGARDLSKLINNSAIIQRLLLSVRAQRWILLCPFLDDKEVVVHVRERGRIVKEKRLPFIGPSFEAMVQSLLDFLGEIEQLRLASLGPPLRFETPSPEAVAKSGGEISDRLRDKLARAFPGAAAEQIESRKQQYVFAHVLRENALHSMSLDQPLLWERSIRCLEAEERRLVALGGGALPRHQLAQSIERIEASLHNDLPNLPKSVITQVALGTIRDWLVRCPLDFSSEE